MGFPFPSMANACSLVLEAIRVNCTIRETRNFLGYWPRSMTHKAVYCFYFDKSVQAYFYRGMSVSLESYPRVALLGRA